MLLKMIVRYSVLMNSYSTFETAGLHSFDSFELSKLLIKTPHFDSFELSKSLIITPLFPLHSAQCICMQHYYF